jgi:hypothetical protein
VHCEFASSIDQVRHQIGPQGGPRILQRYSSLATTRGVTRRSQLDAGVWSMSDGGSQVIRTSCRKSMMLRLSCGPSERHCHEWSE